MKIRPGSSVRSCGISWCGRYPGPRPPGLQSGGGGAYRGHPPGVRHLRGPAGVRRGPPVLCPQGPDRRRELFDTLAAFGACPGFPKPWESVHDAFIAGHASNSVSVALGMARARTLQGKDYHVLALIGDGAMGGGLSFEGLNDAGASGEPLIVILNDNGMSIDPNVGGLSRTCPGCAARRSITSSSGAIARCSPAARPASGCTP